MSDRTDNACNCERTRPHYVQFGGWWNCPVHGHVVQKPPHPEPDWQAVRIQSAIACLARGYGDWVNMGGSTDKIDLSVIATDALHAADALVAALKGGEK